MVKASVISIADQEACNRRFFKLLAWLFLGGVVGYFAIGLYVLSHPGPGCGLIISAVRRISMLALMPYMMMSTFGWKRLRASHSLEANTLTALPVAAIAIIIAVMFASLFGIDAFSFTSRYVLFATTGGAAIAGIISSARIVLNRVPFAGRPMVLGCRTEHPVPETS